MSQLDPHSYFDTDHPRTRHLSLNWFIDFGKHQINGSVVLELEKPSAGSMDLDTKGITIQSVCDQNNRQITFDLAAGEPILGRRLRLELPENTTSITISYATSPEAVALQWF